jgi:hypothetical protein
MNAQVTEYQQVAALLNNRIEITAEYFHKLSDEDKAETFAELNEYRVKITTDPEFREDQWRMMRFLFSIGT